MMTHTNGSTGPTLLPEQLSKPVASVGSEELEAGRNQDAQRIFIACIHTLIPLDDSAYIDTRG